MVFFVTGKAGAGKSTYAARLAEELLEEGRMVRVLDGDEVRRVSGNDDYTDAGRQRHLMDMARSAAWAEQLGFTVVVAAIAPRACWRREMRAMWAKSVLVYMPGGQLWEGTKYERPQDDEY